MNLSTIAMLFFGIKYTWGGNTPEQGFDCSGLVLECLRTIGKHGKSDMRAVDIYNKFKEDSKNGEVKKDTILFFGKSISSISHVAISLDDIYMIEAGGEGSNANTNGYVRIRPIKSRRDFLVGVNL